MQPVLIWAYKIWAVNLWDTVALLADLMMHECFYTSKLLVNDTGFPTWSYSELH